MIYIYIYIHRKYVYQTCPLLCRSGRNETRRGPPGTGRCAETKHGAPEAEHLGVSLDEGGPGGHLNHKNVGWIPSGKGLVFLL